MFKIELIGNLGADAEVITKNGSSFVAMRVAHTNKYTQQDGTARESTDWVDVTMNNPESKVLPYLKQGVKIFVRGNASLRVYSSPKDRCMKAGLSVAASEIELCGGSSEAVPREVINPEDGSLYKVAKYYQCDYDTKGFKNGDVKVLVDKNGQMFNVIKGGWIAPAVQEPEPEAEQK